MEYVDCHAPTVTRSSHPMRIHDGVEHVYIRLPRCQDNQHLLDICLGIRHCRDSPLAAVKIDNEALQLLLPARGGLCGLRLGLSRCRARARHHPWPQRRQGDEGHHLYLLRLVWCLACQCQPEVMRHSRAVLACRPVWNHFGPLQPRRRYHRKCSLRSTLLYRLQASQPTMTGHLRGHDNLGVQRVGRPPTADRGQVHHRPGRIRGSPRRRRFKVLGWGGRIRRSDQAQVLLRP